MITPAFYDAMYNAHGTDTLSLGWSSPYVQSVRFNVFRDVYMGGSVLDAGCGFGDMSRYFPDYLGVDAKPEFIKEAQRRHPKKEFLCMDIRAYETPHDYVFASGLLAYQENPVQYIQHLWELANRTLAINWFDTSLHQVAVALGYVDCDIYDIRHSYLPNDFTLTLHRRYPNHASPAVLSGPRVLADVP